MNNQQAQHGHDTLCQEMRFWLKLESHSANKSLEMYTGSDLVARLKNIHDGLGLQQGTQLLPAPVITSIN